MSPHTSTLQKQPSVGNVFARTSSIGSSPGGSPPVQQRGSPGSITRQGSQGSIFEQITTQARELVRETTRQSSQDGLLAHMDKVSYLGVFFLVNVPQSQILCFRMCAFCCCKSYLVAHFYHVRSMFSTLLP